MKHPVFIALSAVAMAAFGIKGFYLLSFLPQPLMMVLGFCCGFLAMVALYFLMHQLTKRSGRNYSPSMKAVFAFITTMVLLKWWGFGWPNTVYYPVFLWILATVLLGNAYLKTKKAGMALAATIFLMGTFAIVGFFMYPGNDPFPVTPITITEDEVHPLSGLEDPSKVGAFSVRTITYGAGTDTKRKAYGEDVAFSTPTVDGRLLLTEWTSKKQKWRERYWGFGAEELPLNARVYLPEGEGPFPMVMMVHGNHSMIDYSDGGYAYLGQMLASSGILAVSVDENFLNGHWSGDFRGKEMPLRAWLLLKHLEQWRQWNEQKAHPLFQKADLNRVVLMGHSRGGEAVAIAHVFNRLRHFPDNGEVVFDFNFGIKGIISLAPTDYRYDRKMTLSDVSILSLQGSYDVDEVSFWGMRPARRAKFTGGGASGHIQAGVYIHKGNHAQFNTDWGRSDFGAPRKWLLNLQPIIPADQQRTSTKVFISAFVQAVLQNNHAYLPIFKNYRWGMDWLPPTEFLTHFSSDGVTELMDFESDIALNTAPEPIGIQAENLALWREKNLRTRDGEFQDNNALVLGWISQPKGSTDIDATPYYRMSWPKSNALDVTIRDALHLSLGAGDPTWLVQNGKDDLSEKGKETPLDFHLRLTDTLGNTASLRISDIKPISPRLKTRFNKLSFLDEDMGLKPWEVQLESFHFPLAHFQKRNTDLDLGGIQHLDLRFDVTEKGVLVVDDIGMIMGSPVGGPDEIVAHGN